MNHPAPIRINIDNQEQIASLYGVGPKLAERIVKYRKEVVFFHNPEDLANVDGISLELALALSPHIDWELPIQDTLPVGRDLFWASIFAISASSVIYIMIMKDTIPNLYYWIGEYQNNLPYAWTGILRIIANLILYLTAFMGLAALSASSLTTVSRTEKQLSRIAIRLFFLSFISYVFSRLAYILYYQFYEPESAITIMKNWSRLSQLIAVIVAALILLPELLVLWRPELLFNVLLRRIYNFGFAMGAPLVAIVIWVTRGTSPLWFMILYGFMGAMVGYWGIDAIRTGKSYFDASFIDPRVLEKTLGVNRWQTWLNIRLPDPEQQKELKQALEQTYPPSRLNTLMNVIVVAAGGWLVSTALSAIIQWLIEKFLNRLWP